MLNVWSNKIDFSSFPFHTIVSKKIMGVLRLFRHLLNTYKDFYTLHKSGLKARYVDVLLLDLNAIFHPACRSVYFPPTTSLLHRPSNKPQKSPEELEQLAFTKIIDAIEAIIQLTPPSKVLYLAIDGVAGMCKQSQQRKRRYKAAKDAKEVLANASITSTNPPPFNTAHITAGTPWMARLCAFIEGWIMHRKTQTVGHVNLRKVQIIYNDMYIAGEGEHKLIRYLEKFATPTTTYSIYSPDADLIMLCLCLPNGIGYILRENMYDDIKGDWILVNCNQLKENFTQTIGSLSPILLHPSFQQQRLVSDYVLFLMLIGNDFLPSMYCLEIGNQGIEILERAYATTVDQIGYLVNDMLCIDQSTFVFLFGLLASREPEMIMKKSLRNVKYPDHLLAECIEHVTETTISNVDAEQIQTKRTIPKLNFPGLRELYYQRKFSLNIKEKPEEIKTIVMAFVRGLNFVMAYYTKGIPTFEWCYEYHYAPLMTDVLEVCSKLTNTEWNSLQEWEFKPALTLNQALLGIIPPFSVDVLPATIQPILIKHASDDLFKDEFLIDYEGKHQDYEGICLLPNVPYAKLKRLCKETNVYFEPKIY